MKKIMSITLIICMVASLFITPVSAMQCCSPYIAGIEQGDEKLAVNLEWQETSAAEKLIVHIWHNSNDWYSYVAEKEYTLSGAETAATVEFDNSLFIKDETYHVAVICGDCTECDVFNSYKEINFEKEGMPVYDISGIPSEEIMFDKSDYKAIRVTAENEGIYKIGVDTRQQSGDWGLKFYKNNHYNNTVDESMIYFREGQTQVFKAKVMDDYQEDTLTANLTFEPATVYFEEPETDTPDDGDVVYSLNNPVEYGEYIGITIPKKGVYTIESNAPQAQNNAQSFLYDSTASWLVEWKWNTDATEMLLEEGNYYIATFNVPEENQETIITYKKPEAFESFGTEISLESNQVIYKSIKLDSSAFITKADVSGDGLDVSLLDENFEEQKDIRDYKNWTNLIAPGEYILEIRAYNAGSAVITKTQIPTTVIGEQISSAPVDNEGNYTYVKAPETAEYEFYFGNDNAMIDDDWISSGTYYYEMKKDEIKLVYWEGDGFTVKKLVPEYSELSFGDNSISLNPQKKQYYSYTAQEKGSYKFNIDMDGTFYLKLYKDEQEIFNGDYFGDTQQKKQLKADLDMNESIYFCLSSAYENNLSINIADRYTKIKETGVVDCSGEDTYEEKEFLYAPEQAGYYTFSFNKAANESDYYSINVEINGQKIGGISNNEPDKTLTDKFYASADEPVEIVLTYYDNQSCTANMIFERITAIPVTDISNFKIEDESYYSVILPETGIYKITGTAIFNASDWRDEGEYGYCFYPVIKNYREAIFCYDAQEGEIPSFFCGNKGDEILFKEESTEYYSFEYPITASITEADAEEIQLDTIVSSNDDYKIYCVKITEDGKYKFEDFSEELIYDNIYYGRGYASFCDGGEWNYVGEGSTVVNEEYIIFELKAGVYYIAAGTYDSIPEDEHDPKAEFKISKIEEEKPDEELTYSDKSFIYDGNEKSLELNGSIPKGVKVTYSDNKGTDAGTYRATAVVSGNEYETKTFTATLTISKAPVTVADIDLTNETATLQGVIDADKDAVSIDFDKLDTVVDTENSKVTISNFVLKGDKAKNYNVTTENLQKNVTISSVTVATPENIQLTAQKAEGTKTIIIDSINVSAVSEETEKIELDMTENGAVDTVSVPKNAFTDLKDKAELEIKLTDGSVSFDKAALAAIEDAAVGDSVSLKIDKPTDEELEGAQITEKNKLENPVVYSFTLHGVTDSQFDGGNATVTVGYNKTGSGDVKAKYLKDDGTAEAVSVAYNAAAKEATMTLGHFSDYVIYTESATNRSGGGGGGAPSYTVKFELNGAQTIANKVVTRGNILQKPEEPKKDGYTFGGWFTDKELTNEYDFESKVTKSFTLYAKWIEGAQNAVNRFDDVKADDWFAEAVEFVSKNKLMNGVSENIFAPYDNLSRAMLVTVLYRMEKEPEVSAESKFSDVKEGSYYEKAVVWAQENNIVNGYSDTLFMPDEDITREQIATIMYRYVVSKNADVTVGENTNILSYDDFADVSEFAVSAMQYAVGSELIKGKSETTLNPKDNATRAELAQIFFNMLK